METNELQKIWKDAGREMHQKSKDELNLLLTHVTRQTINKFMLTIGVGILTGVGVIIFLSYTSLRRPDDTIYLINNLILGVISLISIFAGLISWHRLQSRKSDQPLKSWLETRIGVLTRLVKGKFNRLYILAIPVIYALTVLSIHVYFENKPFMEVLGTEESVIGLIVGTPVGLFAAFYTVRKIRRNEVANLEFLQDMYERLCKAE
jgi:hypothetical protein